MKFVIYDDGNRSLYEPSHSLVHKGDCNNRDCSWENRVSFFRGSVLGPPSARWFTCVLYFCTVVFRWQIGTIPPLSVYRAS